MKTLEQIVEHFKASLLDGLPDVDKDKALMEYSDMAFSHAGDKKELSQNCTDLEYAAYLLYSMNMAWHLSVCGTQEDYAEMHDSFVTKYPTIWESITIMVWG